MKEIKNILEFKGNEDILAALCLDENNKLFALYAKIKNISFEGNNNSYNYFNNDGRKLTAFTQEFIYQIILELDTFKDSHLMAIIEVRDVEEYEHIYSVLESFI